MVFISYSNKDKNMVLPIINRLRSNGREVWVDFENLDLSAPLEMQILNAINKCETFVHIVSNNSQNSKWVKFEKESAKKLKNAHQIKEIDLESFINSKL